VKLNLLYSIFLLLFCATSLEGFSLNVRSKNQQKTKLVLCLIKPDERMKRIAFVIQRDLQCNAMQKLGFRVSAEEMQAIPDKNYFKEQHKKGNSLALLISDSPEGIQWRLYDCRQANQIAGKLVAHVESLAGTGHFVSDKVWQALTGQEGIFSTMIAYCKERHEANHFFKDIYVQNPFTKERIKLVEGGKPLAPRWNLDLKNPMLLYSEATPSNIRLMSSTMNGKRSVVSNFEGLNMLPSFSRDGTKVVYCFTHEGKTQLFSYGFDKRLRKPALFRITNNQGNNTSPTLRDNGDVIFCSDFETKAPQLYYYHADSKITERLTQGGYCAAPAFNKKTERIAYSKMVSGTPQLFVYDLKTKKHEQVTFGKGIKDECSWSPCGNYLVYAYELQGRRRVAMMNLIVKEQTFLTDESEHCCYPSWSPQYKSYIEVRV
jgi:TolB protein